MAEGGSHHALERDPVARCPGYSRAGHVVGHQPVEHASQVAADLLAPLRQQQVQAGADGEGGAVERLVGQLARQPERGHEHPEGHAPEGVQG